MQQTRVVERPFDSQYDPIYTSSNWQPRGTASNFRPTLVLRREDLSIRNRNLEGGALPPDADVSGSDRHR